MSKSKYWCFTLNNPTEEELLYLRTNPNEFSYIGFGHEHQSLHSQDFDNHSRELTYHLQGYVEANRRLTLASLKKVLPRAHWEQRRGSQEQAVQYCQKEGNFESFGTLSTQRQGKRNDLDALKVALNDKMPLQQISQEFFTQFLHYRKNIESYIALNQEKRTWIVDVVVYWGESRTGKTRKAYEEAGQDVWVYPGKGWFDGYHGQDNVLFDDFYGDMPISLLLKVLDDYYPCSVPTKGGHVNWKPRKVWITSNTDPRDWYSDGVPQAVRTALWNRLKIIQRYPIDLGDNLTSFFNQFSS